MNTPADFDLIIIGAGSAGYNGASTAAELGLRVALIDGAEELGGLCILRGCMPSKALIAGANRFHTLRHSQDFGITSPDARINLEKLMARKNRLIGEFAHYRRGQIQNGPFTFLRGKASFLDPHTLEILAQDGTTSRITGHTFLLATGSVLNPPPIPGIAEIGYLSSDTALELAEIPKSLIILGAGAIGLEFAHYFNALGSKVTILQRSPHILKGADTDISDTLRRTLEKRGITIITSCSLDSAERTPGGKTVHYTCTGQPCQIEAEEIFQALGRHPNLLGLGLEKAGLCLDHYRPEIGPTQQSCIPHIFAAGDVAGPYEIVHIAIQQAEVAVRNAAKLIQNPAATLETTDYRLKLFVLFTHPEVAQVGLTEREAADAGEDFAVATYPFDDHGKSLVMGEPDGFVKLIARRSTGEILGGAVIGPEASSLIHEIAAVMHFHGTARDLAAIPHYHPTLAEIWTYPAEALADQIAG